MVEEDPANKERMRAKWTNEVAAAGSLLLPLALIELNF